jgi:hypothetical protein
MKVKCARCSACRRSDRRRSADRCFDEAGCIAGKVQRTASDVVGQARTGDWLNVGQALGQQAHPSRLRRCGPHHSSALTADRITSPVPPRPPLTRSVNSRCGTNEPRDPSGRRVPLRIGAGDGAKISLWLPNALNRPAPDRTSLGRRALVCVKQNPAVPPNERAYEPRRTSANASEHQRTVRNVVWLILATSPNSFAQDAI